MFKVNWSFNILVKNEEHMICYELFGFCRNKFEFFRTYVLLSTGAVLMNIGFIELEYNGKERTMRTTCHLDICYMFRSEFPIL